MNSEVRMKVQVQVAPGEAAVDLNWLPLGAGNRSVQMNGRIVEAVEALAQRRPASDLYHSALEIRLPEGRFIIEQACSAVRLVRHHRRRRSRR